MRSLELPSDPSWVTAPGVAMLVAGLGGATTAAWLFCWMSPVPDFEWWLAIVMFMCTFALTVRAVDKALESPRPLSWLKSCAVHGAINGVACAVLYLPIHAHRGVDLMIALCASPFALLFGTFFGVLFFAGYVPVLALAQRARAEPSLDLLSRMAPWCAAWLTAIGLAAALVGERQTVLGIACLAVAVLVSVYGVRADRRRKTFLDHLESDERVPDHHFSRETSEPVLPFVALGDVSRTLVHEAPSEHGPFRSAASTAPLAAFSRDSKRERRALGWRLSANALILAAGAAGLAYAALA